MVFIVLWNRGQQGGVLKLKYFQPLGFFFWSFQVSPRVDYITNTYNDKNDTCSCVCDGFCFVFDRGYQGLVIKSIKNDHF